MRHRILLMGTAGSGKSRAIIDLAFMLPDSQVIAFDRQDGIRPILYQLGETPPNLELHLVGGEPLEAWQQLRGEVIEARKRLRIGDWICYDVALDFWELMKQSYVVEKYGMEIDEHMDEADEEGFGGFSAKDWEKIHARHYVGVYQSFGAACPANVLVTAHLKSPAVWVDKKTGVLQSREKHLLPQYMKAGIKPAGESTLTDRVDVALHTEHPTETKWRLRTLGKNRFGVEFDWVNFTNETWAKVYLEQLKREEF